MAYLTVTELFTAICNSIRAKLGSSSPIAHQDIPASIDAIVTGSGGADVSGVTATAGDVLAPKVFVDSLGVEKEGTITSKGAATYTPSESAQEIAAGQYLSGKQTIAAIPSKYKDMTGTDVVAGNILSGKKGGNTTGVITGNMPNNSGDKSAVSYHRDGTSLHIVPPEGYVDGSDDAVIITDADFKAENIKSGVNIFGIDGSLSVSSWTNASGTVQSNASGDVTISGLPFTPKLLVTKLMLESEYYINIIEYIDGHWLASSDGDWRYNSDSFVTASSGSITLSAYATGVQTITYSVWG